MSRMDLTADERLRARGWAVFRSSTREHVIPQTGPGRSLQRVKVAQALPVGGVTEGVALSFEERKANDDQRKLALALAERSAVGTPLGITQYLNGLLTPSTTIESAAAEFKATVTIGFAPFDGFIREFLLLDDGGVPLRAIGVRSSGGATMFRTNQNDVPGAGFLSREPDLINAAEIVAVARQQSLVNVRMPVFAGEEIFAVMIVPAGVPATDRVGSVVLGFEAFILARPGSAAAQSMFGALTVEARRAATESASLSGRLELEREKTRRAALIESGATERAKLAVEVASAKSRYQMNDFQRLLVSEQGRDLLASRAPVAPPPAPGFAAAAPAPSGVGMVFVQSWQPAMNSIGYLIPEAPRGGRVNVFDNKYTIWDLTGQKVGEGQITPVSSTANIPPGVRISPMRGGAPPAGLGLTGPGVSAGATAAGLSAGEVFPLP